MRPTLRLIHETTACENVMPNVATKKIQISPLPGGEAIKNPLMDSAVVPGCWVFDTGSQAYELHHHDGQSSCSHPAR
jgi:hypothetical protein